MGFLPSSIVGWPYPNTIDNNNLNFTTLITLLQNDKFIYSTLKIKNDNTTNKLNQGKMKSDFKSTEKKKKKELLQLIKINHFINEK